MKDAFRAEMIALLPRLKRFALGLTLDPALAAELVQTGCERALERQGQWQPGTRLDRWMFTILRNLWIDEMRTKPALVSLEREEFENLPDRDWNRRMEAQLTLEQVLRCMDGLSEDMRAVLVLACVEGLAYKEVAEALGVPVGTVMSRLARARIALYKAMGDLQLNAADGGHHAHLH